MKLVLLASLVLAPLASAQTPPASSEADAVAPAATDLSEVVVTARNRLEPLKDVPLSISVVTGKELERELSYDTPSFTKRAANVTWNTGNPRQGSLSIRGVGKQGQTDAQDPSVGVIVDGVNFAYNPLSFYNFIDIESLEVTRGPQGTLLGKNTTMGVVSINTRKPSFDPDFNYSLSFGKNDSIITTAAGGGPVIDDLLAWRGSFYVDKEEGPFKNTYDNGRRSYTDKNRVSGRLQFLLTPNEDLSIRLTGEVTPRAGENSNGLTFYKPVPASYSNGTAVNLGNDASTRLGRRWFAQDSSYTYARDFLGTSDRQQPNNDAQQPLVTGTTAYTAYIDWKLGDFTLTSISAYRDYYFDARNDEGTPFDITLNSNTTVDYAQKSQELRITSPTGGFFDYQAGFFFLNATNTYNAKQEWGSDAGAWFATVPQYANLDVNSAGRQLLDNSLNRLYRLETQWIDNKSSAVFGQANWHFTGQFTVTTGLRFTREDRSNTTNRVVTDNGYGRELNPALVNGIDLGGFSSNATGALVAGNSGTQLALADYTANKYFGSVIAGAPGATYNALTTAQKLQVANAKSLRAGQLGTPWATTVGTPFKETQPSYNLSPSFKITPNVTAYASYQYGEKAGIVQFVNGIANNARPEKATAYELGLKSVLLNRTLVINADVFQNDIKDYQQAVQVLDVYTTNLRNDGQFYYTSATGNVPKVQVRGVELDATYSGLPYTTLRIATAYNDAKYDEFSNSGQPSENGYAGAAPYRDVSGQALPGAPKFTASLSGEFRYPVFSDKEFHASFTHFITSSYNSDNLLSSYGAVGGYSLTDLAAGVGRNDGLFDLSVIVKNAFDTTYRSEGWTSWSPATPRWYGIVVRGRL